MSKRVISNRVVSSQAMSDQAVNIIGAGALGHLWSAYLQKSDQEVRLYARNERVASHLSIKSASEHFHSTFNYLTLNKWQDSQFLLICVKAYHLETLCVELKPLLGCTPSIILMMNGMGLVEIVQRHLPNQSVLQASFVQGALLAEDELRHSGEDATMIGNLQNEPAKTLDLKFIGILNKALPEVQWQTNHACIMWQKLVINAVINPLTALSGQTNRSIVVDNQLTSQADTLLQEIFPLITNKYPALSYDYLYRLLVNVANKTALNKSSMLQDILQKRPTEIEYIVGYLLEQAEKEHILMPRLHKLYNKIKTIS